MKYLFTAFYSDATSYAQTPEDKALTKPTGSAYSDIDHSKLVGFLLAGGAQNYYVDLLNGDITLSGPINCTIKSFLGAQNYRLIYYRHNTVTTGSPTINTTFCIGWQVTLNGQNHKQILEII